MDDEYFKEQAAHVRKLASMADPFIKRRLLDLAEKYDARMRNFTRYGLAKDRSPAKRVDLRQ
jgi:hypothetical protein